MDDSQKLDPAGLGAQQEIARKHEGERTAFRIAGYMLIFTVIGAVVFVFVKTLVFNKTIQSLALQQSVISASVGITVVCIIAWMLNLLGFVRLRDGWAKLLWVVLISSILGNSAIIYKKWVTHGDVAVRALCLRPLEELGKDEPPKLRANATFRRGERIPYLLTIDNISTNDDGFAVATLHSSLEKAEDRTAVFHNDPLKSKLDSLHENPVVVKRHKQYRDIAPDCVPENALAIGFLKSFQTDKFVPGTYALKVTIFDLNNSSYATAELPIYIIE